MTTEPIFNPPTPREDPEAPARLQKTLQALLAEGQRFTTVLSDPITAEELRGWAERVRFATLGLADHLEAPARAAVLTLIDHTSVGDDVPALYALRTNIAGASPNQLGDEVGVNGNTIRRIEEQRMGCNPSTAKKLADRFGLRVHELFSHDEDHGDKLVGVTVAQLRLALLSD
jgi:DNA-binding XRE family transcriptional regulator